MRQQRIEYLILKKFKLGKPPVPENLEHLCLTVSVPNMVFSKSVISFNTLNWAVQGLNLRPQASEACFSSKHWNCQVASDFQYLEFVKAFAILGQDSEDNDRASICHSNGESGLFSPDFGQPASDFGTPQTSRFHNWNKKNFKVAA